MIHADREASDGQLRAGERRCSAIAVRCDLSSQATAERDAGQESREHRRERVDTPAHDVREHACPKDLVEERIRAGDEHERHDPRGLAFERIAETLAYWDADPQ